MDYHRARVSKTMNQTSGCVPWISEIGRNGTTRIRDLVLCLSQIREQLLAAYKYRSLQFTFHPNDINLFLLITKKIATDNPCFICSQFVIRLSCSWASYVTCISKMGYSRKTGFFLSSCPTRISKSELGCTMWYLSLGNPMEMGFCGIAASSCKDKKRKEESDVCSELRSIIWRDAWRGENWVEPKLYHFWMHSLDGRMRSKTSQK
jgi:hypothetical protein